MGTDLCLEAEVRVTYPNNKRGVQRDEFDLTPLNSEESRQVAASLAPKHAYIAALREMWDIDDEVLANYSDERCDHLLSLEEDEITPSESEDLTELLGIAHYIDHVEEFEKWLKEKEEFGWTIRWYTDG